MLSNDNHRTEPADPQAEADRGTLIGVDIGGTKTAVCLSRLAPEIVWRQEFPTLPELGPAHALRSIVAAIRTAIAETGAQPSRIGVSCGGPLDSARGIIQRPPNLVTWDDVPITYFLSDEIGIPCALENDANAGAMAEHRFGAGRGTRHMVFLTLGTGLGAGLILNGELFSGASNMAGEIGHVRLSETGPEGYGKAGSVEGWASGGGMARLGRHIVEQAIRDGEHTPLAAQLDTLTAREIAIHMQLGDPVARRIVDRSGQRLGEALAILVDILNPQRIVIGGLALRFGEDLLAPARAVLQKEALAASVDACNIVPAQLGERIGDVAALCVALNAKVHA